MEVGVYIYKFELHFDRELDDELYSYLKKYCDVPHYALDVNLFKIEVPNWKDYSFFGCTGAKGEFVAYDHRFVNLKSVLTDPSWNSIWPIDSNLSYNTPFCMKNKRELERREFINIIAADHMKNWLKFFIDNFLETAPDPYFLNGVVILEGVHSKTQMVIQIKDNKMFSKEYEG